MEFTASSGQRFYISHMDWRYTNWQTRLALDWLMHDTETMSDWRAHAATRNASTVASDLAMALVSEISALPESWARDAAMITAQSIDWQALAIAVADNDLADVARKDYRDLH